jgi:uncharacterized protein (TIGR03435 family)
MKGVLFGIAIAACAWAQTAAPPRFEVASDKEGADLFATRPERSQGRIPWTTQLAYRIGYAYGLDLSRVSWASLGAIYTAEATYDPAATEADVRLMLQSLLSDRFRMRSHRASAARKSGTSVEEAKGNSGVARGGPHRGSLRQLIPVMGERDLEVCPTFS